MSIPFIASVGAACACRTTAHSLRGRDPSGDYRARMGASLLEVSDRDAARIASDAVRTGIACTKVAGVFHSTRQAMSSFPKDIYTEPADVDVDTLANLGPLRGMAGSGRARAAWTSIRRPRGPGSRPIVEHIELQPIDPQTNGPQLFYGLRYHSHVSEAG